MAPAEPMPGRGTSRTGVPDGRSREDGVEVVDDGPQGRALGQVLRVELGLEGGGTVEDGHEEIAAVAGEVDADDLLRAVALAEQLLVRSRGAEAMAIDARAFWSQARVIDARLVRGDGDAGVARLGQRLDLPPRIHVHETHFDLVLAALPHAVGQETAVGRDVLEVGRDRVLRAQPLRVDEDLRRSLSLPDVKDRLLLIRSPLAVEEAAAAH